MIARLACLLLLLSASSAMAQTPCVVPSGNVTLPLQCPAGTYTSPGVTLTPVVEPPPIPPAEDDPLKNLAPGSWGKYGGRVTGVFPNPQPPGGSTGIYAYSGAARGNQTLYVLGGGHQDSSDNAVYAFNTQTLAWTRAWGPSALATIPAKGTACSVNSRKYADGNPSARHTYHGVHWIGPDKLLLIGGSMWCAAGDAANDAWEVDLRTGVWTERPAPPFYLPLGVKGGALADGTVYLNASTSNNQLYKRLTTGAWHLVGGPPAPNSNAAAIDPKRGLLVYLTVVGSGVGISTQRLDTGALTPRTLTGDALPQTTTAQLGSLDYDDSTDRMIVWAGLPTLYAINLDTNTVTQLPGTGTPPGVPSTAGTFGRFRCLPGRGVCILLRSVGEEPFVYRVAQGGPVPPQPPVQYTMTVSQTGTGHGTATGAGSYPAGATVPLSATPDAGSTFGGWVETPCRTSPYLMPAANALCTASFTVVPVPPTGNTLIPGTFLRLAAPTWRGPSAGSKHVTATYRPDNQKIYLQGGDFIDAETINLHRTKGWGEPDDSYRQNGYAFDLAARLAGGPDAGWQRIQEYCQASLSGGLQPKYPDFIGWAWDATRKVFWITPGLFYKANQNKAVCPGETYSETSDAAYRWSRVMAYAPDEPDLAKRWTDVGGDSLPHDSWASFYDPVTDTLVRMGHHGGNGGEVHIFAIPTQTWTRKQLETSATGSLRLMRSLPCVDLANRRAFIGDPWNGKWWRYNMDARTVTAIPPIPYGRQMDKDEDGQVSADLYSYAAWRPNMKECWVWRNDVNKLLVYQSDLNTWREEAWTPQVAGGVPKVLHAITWHHALDALVFLGNRTSGSTGIWVYKP